MVLQRSGSGSEIRVANVNQKIIRAVFSIHIRNRVSIETYNGYFEPLFSSPRILNIRTVSHICVYFPDPGNNKSVQPLRNKSMFLRISLLVFAL